MTQSKADQDVFEIAPCLQSGPLSSAGLALVEAAKELPQVVPADVARTWATYYVFIAKERAFRGDSDPTPGLTKAMEQQARFLPELGQLDLGMLTVAESTGSGDSSDVEAYTGDHYGNLFKDFDAASYFGEATKLLRARLERNGCLPADLRAKVVLDAGCGGGRYTVAWQQLGAKEAVGVDFSDVGIESARARIADDERYANVRYQKENVLALSFEDDAFDVVFSNGVLHHTTDVTRGIAELVRVLKPGGFGWLYLIEKPGGYFWDTIEILRVVMRDVDKTVARNALKVLGVPANRIFYILDHIMVPINVRLTGEEIERCLAAHGARDIRRLTRGFDFDRVEQIHQKQPFAEMKYGVGEHRYVFTK